MGSIAHPQKEEARCLHPSAAAAGWCGHVSGLCLLVSAGGGAEIRVSPRFPLAPPKIGAPYWGPLRAQAQPTGSCIQIWKTTGDHLLLWSFERDPFLSGSHGPRAPSHICVLGPQLTHQQAEMATLRRPVPDSHSWDPNPCQEA